MLLQLKLERSSLEDRARTSVMPESSTLRALLELHQTLGHGGEVHDFHLCFYTPPVLETPAQDTQYLPYRDKSKKATLL